MFVRRLYPRPSTGDTLRDLTRSSSIRVGDAVTTEDNSNPAAARQAKKSFMILNELQNDRQQTVFILIDDVCVCS